MEAASQLNQVSAYVAHDSRTYRMYHHETPVLDSSLENLLGF